MSLVVERFIICCILFCQVFVVGIHIFQQEVCLFNNQSASWKRNYKYLVFLQKVLPSNPKTIFNFLVKRYEKRFWLVTHKCNFVCVIFFVKNLCLVCANKFMGHKFPCLFKWMRNRYLFLMFDNVGKATMKSFFFFFHVCFV